MQKWPVLIAEHLKKATAWFLLHSKKAVKFVVPYRAADEADGESQEVIQTGTLTVPVVEHDGYFWFLIPLEPGGKHFVNCSKGISIVEDGYLKIFIPATVAESLGIRDGSMVQIKNCDRELNIQLSDSN